LAEGAESFSVISGAIRAERLKKVLMRSENVVMLKVYRSYSKIKKILHDLNLSRNSILGSRCGLNGERSIRDLEENCIAGPLYLSFLLIRKAGP
jgi:precorrin-2/cobalt-factor-2 C20-methyltransferase